MIAPLPNPVPVAKNKGSPAAREIFCAFYDSCLGVAAKKNWAGFTCRDCELRGLSTSNDLRPDPWARTQDPAGSATPRGMARSVLKPTSPVRGGFYLDVLERIPRDHDVTREELAKQLGATNERVRSALQTLSHRQLITNTGPGTWRRK